MVPSRLRFCAPLGDVVLPGTEGAWPAAAIAGRSGDRVERVASPGECSAPKMAVRNSATVCGRLDSSDCMAHSMARSSESPNTLDSASADAGIMLSVLTREADSIGFLPVTIQYI